MVSDAKQFCYFAFRALRHVPKDWRSHYRYELLNALRQRDFQNHTSKEISSRPEYYTLNAIKQGYHGVKWVLSRFDVECPPLPEAFADPDTPIYTNEASHEYACPLQPPPPTSPCCTGLSTAYCAELLPPPPI